MVTQSADGSVEIPRELDRWNWGAFLLNWIWGIGNNTYIALLMFVPFVNLVMMFVLGAKGSGWAWRNQTWRDAEHFRKAQRKWAIAGVLVWIGSGGFVGGIFVSVALMLQTNGAYEMAMKRVSAEPRVVEAIGDDLKAGFWVGGSINLAMGGTGEAKLNIPVHGKNGRGTVVVHAVQFGGQWTMRLLVVTVDGRKTPLVLINADNMRIPGAASEI